MIYLGDVDRVLRRPNDVVDEGKERRSLGRVRITSAGFDRQLRQPRTN